MKKPDPFTKIPGAEYFGKIVEKTTAGLFVARDPEHVFKPNRAHRRGAIRASRLRGRGYTTPTRGRKLEPQPAELVALRKEVLRVRATNAEMNPPVYATVRSR